MSEEKVEKKSDKKAAPKMVKLKILKFVGMYEAGQIVEVSEEEAKHLLVVGEYQLGEDVVKSVRAMKLDDYEKSVKVAHAVENLTAAEAAELGVKNIVETPKE